MIEKIFGIIVALLITLLIAPFTKFYPLIGWALFLVQISIYARGEWKFALVGSLAISLLGGLACAGLTVAIALLVERNITSSFIELVRWSIRKKKITRNGPTIEHVLVRTNVIDFDKFEKGLKKLLLPKDEK